jgi:hypothetical protein
VEYFVDDKSIDVITSAPFTAPIRVPRSVDKNGTHTLKITITDQYYNTASDSTNFTFGADSSGPSIRLLTPAAGATIKSGDSLSMSADANDPAGVKYVEFFLNNQLLTTKPQAPYMLTYPVTLPVGTYTLKTVATDFSGNKADDSVVITVTQ